MATAAQNRHGDTCILSWLSVAYCACALWPYDRTVEPVRSGSHGHGSICKLTRVGSKHPEPIPICLGVERIYT